MYEDDRMSLKERVQMLEDLQRLEKRKDFKIPFKGRVGRMKVKSGYVTVVTIHDNKNIDFTKEPIVDGTVKLSKDLTYHAVDSKDVFFYKNKPIIFVAKNKLNPYNPLKGEHETYGQKYVLARMEGDKISLKKSLGWGATVAGLVILGIIAYAFITNSG